MDNEFMQYSKLNLDRFYARFQKGRDEDCWTWLGSKNEKGYGTIGHEYAHRRSWKIHNNADIPKGMCICHSCDNPSCVNPSHLWLGTQKENMQDMKMKGRQVIRDNKGIANPMFGRQHGEETRRIMAEAKKGIFLHEKHPRATITMETADEIRRLKNMGISAVRIASDLGVSIHVVRNIVRGKTWVKQ